MNCSEFEILLCDYLDETLRGEQKLAFESHLASCKGCAELAKDAGGVVAFMERVADVEPPAELVTKLLFEVPSATKHASRPSLWSRLVGSKLLEPVLQPRFAMGMAMTILSFSMLAQFARIPVRQLTMADLDPVKVYSSAEQYFHRGWVRAQKYYEDLRVVYEIQTRLKEWTEEDELERDKKTGGQPAAPAEANGNSAESGSKAGPGNLSPEPDATSPAGRR